MSRQLEQVLLLAVLLGAFAVLVMMNHKHAVPSSTSYLPAEYPLDPAYARAAFCGDSPVKGGDAQQIADWAKANHVECDR